MMQAMNSPGVPSKAASNLRSAQSSLMKALASAAAHNPGESKAQAEAAAASLQQAKQSMAQGDGKGEGKDGKSQQASKAKGKGQKGEKAGKELGQSTANEGQDETEGAGNSVAVANGLPAGQGTFVALPQRDRNAIQQSQGEKYPAEFGAAIEQYLRNLSETEPK